VADAELNIKTKVTLVPMLIEPGDTVLIPTSPTSTLAQIHKAKDVLEQQFPGVTFQFVGSPMQHALVYRPKPIPGGCQGSGAIDSQAPRVID